MKNLFRTFQEKENWFDGVMTRADHHAKEVINIVPRLYFLLETHASDLQVKYRDNEAMGNVLWFKINGEPHCLAYNHNTKKIDFRNRNQKGTTIASFDNESQNIEQYFLP